MASTCCPAGSVRGVEEGLFGRRRARTPARRSWSLIDGEAGVTGADRRQGRSRAQRRRGASTSAAKRRQAHDVAARSTSPPGRTRSAFTWRERPQQEQNTWEPGPARHAGGPQPVGHAAARERGHRGPYERDRRQRHAERETPVRLPAGDGRRRHRRAPTQIVSSLARRAFRRPGDGRRHRAGAGVLQATRARTAATSTPASAPAWRACSSSPCVPVPRRTDPPTCRPGTAHRISDLELASRLSFFLWSSIPDDELLDLAVAGRLREPGVLEAQVRRMVADQRADAFVENFTGQWLQLRNLETKVRARLPAVPGLRRQRPPGVPHARPSCSSRASCARTAASLELLTANYTFVNERLARHYGIPGVYGSRFRRVAADRSEPPRPARPGKHPVDDVGRDAHVADDPRQVHRHELAGTTRRRRRRRTCRRSRRARRRTGRRPCASSSNGTARNPACASCHRNIDPVGFALENFDADGQWRDQTRDGAPIDSAGVLADGTQGRRPVGAAQGAAGATRVFADTVTEKMLIYALGRGLEPVDMPVVRSIVRKRGAEDYAMQSIVMGIVESDPFQMRTKLGPSDPEPATVAQATRVEQPCSSRRSTCLVERSCAALRRRDGAAVPGRDGAGAHGADAHGGAAARGSAPSTSRTASIRSSGIRTKTGSNFEFKPVMQPLEPYRGHLVTVSGMKAPDGRRRCTWAPAPRC